jgi:YD repeat-containing protein
MKKIQCRLCGRDIEYEYLSKKAQCGHCGIFVFFDEYGTLTAFDVNDELFSMPLNTENSSEVHRPQTNEEIVAQSDNKATTEEKDEIHFKPRKKKHYVRKTIIITSICLAVVLLSILILAPKIKVLIAKDMIEDGKYQEAYLLLKDTKNSSEAKKLLKKFTWKYSTKQSFSGVDQGSKFEYRYDEFGNEIIVDMYTGISQQYRKSTTYESGKIKERITQFYSSDTHQRIKENYSYDDKGNLKSMDYYVDSRLFYNFKYEYDKNGNVIKEIETDTSTNRTFITKKTYDYDAKGNMCNERIFYNNSSTVSKYTTYIYDINGNVIKIIQSNDGTGSCVQEENEYDKNGRIVKKTTPNSTIYYYYDSYGRLKSERDHNHYYDSIIETKYKYNADGKLILITRNENGIIDTEKMKYDKYGNLIQHTQELQSTEETLTTKYSGYVIFYTP